MWEKDININEVREIRSRTLVYFGVGAIAKIADIGSCTMWYFYRY